MEMCRCGLELTAQTHQAACEVVCEVWQDLPAWEGERGEEMEEVGRREDGGGLLSASSPLTLPIPSLSLPPSTPNPFPRLCLPSTPSPLPSSLLGGGGGGGGERRSGGGRRRRGGGGGEEGEGEKGGWGEFLPSFSPPPPPLSASSGEGGGGGCRSEKKGKIAVCVKYYDLLWKEEFSGSCLLLFDLAWNSSTDEVSLGIRHSEFTSSFTGLAAF